MVKKALKGRDFTEKKLETKEEKVIFYYYRSRLFFFFFFGNLTNV